MRTVPAATATDLPAGVAGADVLWDETIAAGRYAAKALARGSRVRFTDLDGEACGQLLLFNALAPYERLNVADTAKVQWQAYLGDGALLLTDMGRVLASVVGDTGGRHDLFCGPSAEARHALLLGVARFGLDRRDVHPCANLLKGVRAVDGDRLAYDGGAGAGTWIELRLELPALVVVANTPHVLDDRRPAAVHAAAARRHGPVRRPGPTTVAGRPLPRRAGPTRTPRTSSSATPWWASRHDDRVDEVVPARAPWSGVVRTGETLRIIDLEGNQAVDFLAYVAGDHGRALRRPGHRGRPTLALPADRQRAAAERGPAAPHGRRHLLRVPRHHRRRLQPGVEHLALRAPHPPPARLRRQLPHRPGALGPGQAGHRVERQLVHERAGRGGRHRSASSTASPPRA